MSRRLTLNQERQLLADLRATARVEMPGEIERLLAGRLGVAAVDQIKAATVESRQLLPGLAAPFGLTHEGRVESPAVKVELMAGVLRCAAGARCEHAASGGRPLLAMLAARVLSCRDCLPRFFARLAAADRRNARKVGDGRLCDFCLEEPVDFWFRPTAIHYGPALVLGDMCSACFEETPAA